MKISNFIKYRNPLGEFVEDFVTESDLKRLIKNHLVRPYDYYLRGNFWLNYPQQVIKLEFVFFVRSFAYLDVL